MLASHNWLKELTGVDAPAHEMADRLTSAGITVDGVAPFAQTLQHVVVAQVRGKRPHPTKDKLTLVEIFDGDTQYELVCGAPNVPEPGAQVVLAKVGAKLPNGMEIAERAVAGVTSRGMLCGETELGIGADDDGIIVLADAERVSQIGASFASTLGLSDFIFDISLTPNRPDCLGHIGIAREVAALYAVKFDPKLERVKMTFGPPARSAPNAGSDFPITIQISDADRCPRYIGAIVTGTSARTSPLAVRARLASLGLRSINALVDATNLVLLEQGHPTHAFDLKKVRGQRIEVRLAKGGEKLQSLDGVERALAADDLVIADAEGAVAIAGVMGGSNSEVDATTTDVLLECAYFEPRGVRRTSRRLALHTDASHRFERGVDPTSLQETIARLAALVQKLGGGTVQPIAVDANPTPHVSPSLVLRHARVAAVLGVAVPASDTRTILERVGFVVTHETPESLTVTVPGYRPDALREIDLIEEIARLRGYDSIPTSDPQIRASTEGTAPHIRFARQLKERAIALGLDEAINYSFVAPHELDAVHAPKARIAVANPLSEERSVLRTSLLAGLAADLRRAQRHQVEGARLFEIARVFFDAQEILPREEKMLGVLLAGARAAWLGDASPIDVYDLKGVLSSLLEPLALATLEVRADAHAIAQAPHLHPRRSGAVLLDGQPVGTMGELHPDLVEKLELVGRPVYAQLSVSDVFAIAVKKGVRRFIGLSRFPTVSRDVALVVDDSVTAGDLLTTVDARVGDVTVQASVFDVYRGQGVPAGKKSVALRLVYSDPNATLTEDRVERTHAAILEKFGKSHDVAQRA